MKLLNTFLAAAVWGAFTGFAIVGIGAVSKVLYNLWHYGFTRL